MTHVSAIAELLLHHGVMLLYHIADRVGITKLVTLNGPVFIAVYAPLRRLIATWTDCGGSLTEQ